MRVAAAQASSAAIAPPVDWGIRDRLREVGVLLRQSPPPRPRIRREPLFEAPVAEALVEGCQGDPPLSAADGETSKETPAPQAGEATSTFFWTAIAVMLAFLLGLGLIWPELFEMVADRLR